MIDPTLKNPDLIKEFYEQNYDKYPGLSLEDFTRICMSPWEYTKKEMESGDLPTIRLKYFGVFQVRKGRAKRMLINLKQRFDLHKIEPKQYFKWKNMLENFLIREDED